MPDPTERDVLEGKPTPGPWSRLGRRTRLTILGVLALVLVVGAIGGGAAVLLGDRSASAPHQPSILAAPPWVTAPDAIRWRRVAGRVPLSHRSYASAVSADGKLVFFGGIAPVHCSAGSLGCTGKPLPDGAVYDPAEGTWTRMTLPPRRLGGPVAAAVDGTRVVYLSGMGYAQVMTYDVRSNTWRTLPSPPVQLAGNDFLAAGGGFAYAADRDDSSGGSQGRVERVDLATGRWTLLPPSRHRPNLQFRQLFVTHTGLLMAGALADDPGHRAQVEILRGGHWRRYPSPELKADGESFAWTGNRLVAPFVDPAGPGRSLDPVTGRWRSLPTQPDGDPGAWTFDPTQGPMTSAGTFVLSGGVVYDAATRHSVVLAQPLGATASGSGTITARGIYVLDAHSQLWWQRL